MKLNFVIWLALSVCFAAGYAAAPELDWSKRIAAERKGQTEYRTPDGSRVDVLTETHAIEVEWAEKWQQAVGQALFYAAATNRQPGIILLFHDPAKERRYYLRCLVVCNRYGIRLETRDTR